MSHDTPAAAAGGRRCEASKSADYYKRRAKAAGTYEHDVWLWYDCGHERCPRQAVMYRRGGRGLYQLCRVHAARPQVYPYLPPGPSCHEPCCDSQERPRATESADEAGHESEVSTWSVGIWRPSRRLNQDSGDHR